VPPKPVPVPKTAQPVVVPDSAPVPAPEQAKLSEVEKKMDELLRLKAARETAAQTNLAAPAPSAAVPAAPKTKREKLNEMLRLVIAGKMTEAEYNAKRNQLINEPD